MFFNTHGTEDTEENLLVAGLLAGIWQRVLRAALHPRPAA